VPHKSAADLQQNAGKHNVRELANFSRMNQIAQHNQKLINHNLDQLVVAEKQ
jgi:hypothetical protein